jgi:hypothetical protein
LADRFDITTDQAEQRLDDALEDEETPIRLDEDAGLFGRVVVDEEENHETEPCFEGENPTQQADKPVTSNDIEPLETAELSGRDFHPSYIKQSCSWWANWVMALPVDDDGDPDHDGTPTKQPTAPYDHGHARPVRWHFGLSDEEHPCTDFEEANTWAGWNTTSDLHAPDRVISDELGLGIILPVDQGPDRPDVGNRTVLLIDWDDVRDPETGEIHPVVGHALAVSNSYAEISQSGEGIHQFVFGEIPGGFSKFIRHIDDEPFIGDDLPAVEIYQSGRVCAMTGDHVDGSGDDVADGQDLVDRLCWEFGTADNAGPGTPSDPFGRRSEAADASVPDHETVGATLQEAAEYDGDDPDEWDIPSEWSLSYAAVIRARDRSDNLAGVANWELNGYAAALGHRDGLEQSEVVADLEAVADDDSIRKEVRQAWRKADAGNYKPPSRHTLAQRGVLPDRFEEETPGHDGHMVGLPNEDELAETANAEDSEVDLEVGDEEPEYGDLTAAHARDRTKARIIDAYQGDEDVLIEALPSMGKSYGTVAAAAETGQPITVLTGRGRKEQYDQIRQWAAEQGFDVGTKGEPDGDVYVLPAFQSDCNTANGDHGEEWADLVDEWYSAGATPSQIHALAEITLEDQDEVDHDHDGLPCQAEGRCDYTRRWDFDPHDFDILIGHYAHAHKPKVVTDRVAVVDEFPEAYEGTLGDAQLKGAVTRYLQEYDRLPFDNWTDLVSNRTDIQRREDALAWLEDFGVSPDEHGAIRFDDEHKHALAPLAVYTILKSAVGGTLGNGYERAHLPHDRAGIGIFDHGQDRKSGEPAVHFLRPPRGLVFSDNVVGLDGTPTPTMWELATGLELAHETVLEGRRAEYLETTLAYRIVQTTDAVKPYNNPDHVYTERDAALLEGIAQHHGEEPAVITTSAARHVWDSEGVITYNADDDEVSEGPVSGLKIHGNVLGSNRFSGQRVGALIGSNHYGDGFIKRWGAYADKSVTRQPTDDETPSKGAELSYGDFGDRILQHMREHDTLQALMRFGRDAGGATVYVDTNTLPEWVPVHADGKIAAASQGMAGVLTALDELKVASAGKIHDHETVDISLRQVHTHIQTLRDIGAVTESADPEDRRRTLYHIADDGGISEYGFADLPTLSDAESSRSETYVNPNIRGTSSKSSSDSRGEETPSSEGSNTGESELYADGGPPKPPNQSPTAHIRRGRRRGRGAGCGFQ